MALPSPIKTLHLPKPAATETLAARLAPLLEPGDVLALHGALGVGKTTFARALVRVMMDDEALEVPSPTFTLVQTYETPLGTLWHFDLYRIKRPEEVAELGFDDARRGIMLVEWPERAGGMLSRARLDLVFTLSPHGKHSVELAGDALWQARLQQVVL
ncbi:MAG: tRNA (adenosine(37)-N6)-threonylcarbamoyltransferase complex ATPase subunit type 1 TsaE [Alphaproteobacteria bacterium]|nr:tRNA (adenosine(37)-N6)-threonylcarbamoyltransferase complex ATPase subunit type 1 TsaE [Alphaproteobacteria bacterium]